jgi:hypothetical protein
MSDLRKFIKCQSCNHITSTYPGYQCETCNSFFCYDCYNLWALQYRCDDCIPVVQYLRELIRKQELLIIELRKRISDLEKVIIDNIIYKSKQ